MRQSKVIITQLAQINKTLAWPFFIFLLASMLQSPVLNKTTLGLLILYLITLNYKDIIFVSLNSFRAYCLLLVIAWEILSISWSKVPITTIRYVGNDVEVLLFSLLSAYQARNKNIVTTLKLTSIVIISAVIAYCIIFPGSSISNSGFTSFYNQKNNLGFAMAICLLIFTITFKNNFLNYAFVFTSASLLFLSQSKTSINLYFIICLLVSVIYLIRIAYKNLTPYTQITIKTSLKLIPIILYSLIVLMVVYRESIADYLMATIPDDALTGRGLLWVTVLTRTKDDLLMGLGPGVFWLANNASEIVQTALYQQSWVKELSAADGGYIDVIGGVGFIGLALLLLSIMQAYRLLFQASIGSTQTGRLIFSLITFFVLHNITETDVFRFIDAQWFLFEFLTFYLIFSEHQPKPFQKSIKKSI